MSWMKINDRRVRVSEIASYDPVRAEASGSVNYVAVGRMKRGRAREFFEEREASRKWAIVFKLRDETSCTMEFRSEADRDAELKKFDAKFFPATSDDTYRGDA